MPTIFYPPTLDWDFMFQRPQQIMRQFAKHGWRVIFCNKTQQRGRPMEEVEPNLFVCHDLMMYIASENQVDVFYTTWAKCVDLVGAIRAKVVVYDRVDDFPQWENYEKYMIDEADIVLATSTILYNKTLQLHDNVHLVNNACDYAHFNLNTESLSTASFGIKRPFIGFVGALGEWVDKDILEDFAEEFSLIIAGAQFGIHPPKDSVFLGAKPYDSLPSLYKALDIGLIPFKENHRVAAAANPIKMYEYLAAGKPIIATETPETTLFPGHIYHYHKGDDIHSLVYKVLSSESAEKKLDRMVIAKKNTWEMRYKQIEKEIRMFLSWKD